MFNQDSLVSGNGSLYADGNGFLDRIDPATGTIAAQAAYSPPLPSPPVIVGNTVWVVWSYSGANVVLHGYNAQTLAQTASVPVPSTGPLNVRLGLERADQRTRRPPLRGRGPHRGGGGSGQRQLSSIGST